MAGGAQHLPVRAVIFDMDGILVDSEPFWREVELGVFAEIGVDIQPLIGHGTTMGMRVDEVVSYFRRRLGFAGPDDATIVGRIVAGVVAAIEERGALLPGVPEALALCERHGLRLALASGSTPPVIDAVLERFDLARRFAVVCSAAHDRFGKPHPEIFLRCAELLGIDAGECLVVEDSLNGCIAGKAARMRVVAIPDVRHRDDPRYAIADLRLGSLAELGSPAGETLLGLDDAVRSA